MKTLRFAITIAASPAAVGHVLLDDALFRKWAASFTEGSHFQGDWSEGATIRFLTPGGDGMVSEIAANRPNEYLSIRHIGVVNQGVADTESDEVKAWAPAYENYTLNEIDGGTELTIHMDVMPEFEEYFSKTWPKALEAIKRLSETRNS